jgi:hypothetical protein
MAAGKPQTNFSIVPLHETSAIHLLLGYKIHFTISRFSGSENSMALSERLLIRPYVETGNDNFKMAAANPDLPPSQRLYKIPN